MLRAFPSGVDVVYEGVGGALQRHLLACLAPGGCLLQVGYISGYPHNHSHSHAQEQQPSSEDCGASVPPSCGQQGGSGSRADSHSTSSSSSSSSSTAASGEAAAAAGGTVPLELLGGGALPLDLPSCADLFWQGLQAELPGGRRLIGQVWPKVRPGVVARGASAREGCQHQQAAAAWRYSVCQGP